MRSKTGYWFASAQTSARDHKNQPNRLDFSLRGNEIKDQAEG